MDWVEVTDRRRSAYERYLVLRLAKVYQWQYSELIALGHVPEGDEFERIQLGFITKTEKIMKAFLSSVYKDTAEDFTKAWSPAAYLPEIDAKSKDADMWSWISFFTQSTIARLVDSNRRRIRRLLVSIEDDDDYISKLKASPFSRPISTAKTVAVTTTTASMNSAMQRTSERYAEGRRRVKTWKTTMRINVRDTHREMERVTIPAEEPFEVRSEKGGYDLMMYPCDQSLGADVGNWINCHCMTFYSYVR